MNTGSMSLLDRQIGACNLQLENAGIITTMNTPNADTLLNIGISADDDYEEVAMESGGIMDTLNRAMDWIESLIKRIFMMVRKGIHFIKSSIKATIGRMSWLVRTTRKLRDGYEKIVKSHLKNSNDAVTWDSGELGAYLLGVNGFEPKTLPAETKRLVELVSFVKNDYLTTSNIFVDKMHKVFETATRLTPNEVLDQVNFVMQSVESNGIMMHPISYFKNGNMDEVHGTSYGANIYSRSKPYLGGFCWTLAYGEVFDKKDKEVGYSEGVLKAVNSKINFSVDLSSMNKSSRISYDGKLTLENNPELILECLNNLLTAGEMTLELFRDDRHIDLEYMAESLQKNIDKYIAAIRSNPDYSSTAGKHIAFIKVGSSFMNNIMQPIQGVPNALARIMQAFCALTEVVSGSYVKS